MMIGTQKIRKQNIDELTEIARANIEKWNSPLQAYILQQFGFEKHILIETVRSYVPEVNFRLQQEK